MTKRDYTAKLIQLLGITSKQALILTVLIDCKKATTKQLVEVTGVHRDTVASTLKLFCEHDFAERLIERSEVGTTVSYKIRFNMISDYERSFGRSFSAQVDQAEDLQSDLGEDLSKSYPNFSPQVEDLLNFSPRGVANLPKNSPQVNEALSADLSGNKEDLFRRSSASETKILNKIGNVDESCGENSPQVCQRLPNFSPTPLGEFGKNLEKMAENSKNTPVAKSLVNVSKIGNVEPESKEDQLQNPPRTCGENTDDSTLLYVLQSLNVQTKSKAKKNDSIKREETSFVSSSQKFPSESNSPRSTFKSSTLHSRLIPTADQKPEPVATQKVEEIIDYWNSKEGLTPVKKLRPDGSRFTTYDDTVRAIKKLLQGRLIPGVTEKYSVSTVEMSIDHYHLAATDSTYLPTKKVKQRLVDFLYNAHAAYSVQHAYEKSSFYRFLEPPTPVDVKSAKILFNGVQDEVVDVKYPAIQEKIIQGYRVRMEKQSGFYQATRAVVVSELVAKKSKDFGHIAYGAEKLHNYIQLNLNRTSRRAEDLDLWVGDLFSAWEAYAKENSMEIFPAQLGESFDFWLPKKGYDKYCKGVSGSVGQVIKRPRNEDREVYIPPQLEQTRATIFNDAPPRSDQCTESMFIRMLRKDMQISATWDSAAEAILDKTYDSHYQTIFFPSTEEQIRGLSHYLKLSPSSSNWASFKEKVPEALLLRICHSLAPYPDFPSDLSIRESAGIFTKLVKERLAELAAEFPKESFGYPACWINPNEKHYCGDRYVEFDIPPDFPKTGFLTQQQLRTLRFKKKYAPPRDYTKRFRLYGEMYLQTEDKDLYFERLENDPFLDKQQLSDLDLAA